MEYKTLIEKFYNDKKSKDSQIDLGFLVEMVKERYSQITSSTLLREQNSADMSVTWNGIPELQMS